MTLAVLSGLGKSGLPLTIAVAGPEAAAEAVAASAFSTAPARRDAGRCHPWLAPLAARRRAPEADLLFCALPASAEKLIGPGTLARVRLAKGQVLHLKPLKMGPGAAAYLCASPFEGRRRDGKEAVFLFLPKWEKGSAEAVERARDARPLEVVTLEGEPPPGLEIPGARLRPYAAASAGLDLPSRVARKLGGEGLSGFVSFAARRLTRRLRHRRHRKAEEKFRREYDERYGIDTMRDLEQNAIYGSVDQKKYAWYDPVTRETFFEALDSLGIALEGFTFVDVGSGKGRALFFATERPFTRILGVEMMRLMHDVAVANAAKFRKAAGRGGNVEPVCADALSFALPPGKTVYFVFNSFGEEVWRPFARRLADSARESPRELYLIYLNPRCKAVLDSDPDFVLLKHRADQDRFGYTEFAVYAVRPHE